MKAGWPALASGEVTSPGLVLKQVRTLDSPIPALAEAILDDAVPRDVLEQVVKVQQRSCDLGPVRLEVTDYWTDPAKTWALDFALQPFTSALTLTVTEDHPALGLVAGDVVHRDHLQADFSHPEMTAGSPWSISVHFPATEPALGLTELHLSEGGQWTLVADEGTATGGDTECVTEELHEGASAYLEALLSPPVRSDD
jgi:hypothetical protein